MAQIQMGFGLTLEQPGQLQDVQANMRVKRSQHSRHCERSLSHDICEIILAIIQNRSTDFEAQLSVMALSACKIVRSGTCPLVLEGDGYSMVC